MKIINLDEIEKELNQLYKEKVKITKEIYEKIDLVNTQKTLSIKEMFELYTIGFYEYRNSNTGSFMSFNSKVEDIKHKFCIKDVEFENYCCKNFKLEMRNHLGGKRMFFENKEDAQKCLEWIESLAIMNELTK